MATLEVLVATIRQKDFSLIKKMNITCDAIIANQCGVNRFEETTINGNKYKMISSNTKGVGKNRNLALLYSEADILLFADDDVVYNDGFDSYVLKEFEVKRNADVIIFGMDLTKKGEIYSRVRGNNRKLHFWNSLHYGTYVVAIRRSSFLKNNLFFNELFGGGCSFSSGEDSLYILNCFRKHMKVYSSSYVLGRCSKDVSTWFYGFSKKYFYDKGAWLQAAFPITKHFIKYYMAFRFRKLTDLTFFLMIKLMNRGIKGYRNIELYRDEF